MEAAQFQGMNFYSCLCSLLPSTTLPIHALFHPSTTRSWRLWNASSSSSIYQMKWRYPWKIPVVSYVHIYPTHCLGKVRHKPEYPTWTLSNSTCMHPIHYRYQSLSHSQLPTSISWNSILSISSLPIVFKFQLVHCRKLVVQPIFRVTIWFA